jgi:DNA-binding NarL/FixJ family response regulator
MLRDILGGEVFYAVSAEGAELPLEEAIAYARRGRGKRKRPAHGWDSLTPTERRVADLVAEGLKNREIGRRLFTSPRTVQTHVSRLFRKLGVSTRAELASKVSKHQAPAR